MKTALPLLLASLLLATGCLGPQDDPTNVHDLRVLGIELEPPEVMTSTCDRTQLPPEDLLVLASQIRYTPLIADPAGQGRAVHYQLLACASQSDSNCSTQGESVQLAEGDFTPEDPKGWMTPSLPLRPGLTTLSDGKTLLLQKVFLEDTYKGLGGLRMPLVLHLTAGTEEVYAQKLMVFNCAFFPESRPNKNPVLPGVTLNGQEWGEADVPTVGSGDAPFTVTADDFSSLEEDYVVPAFDLSEVKLHESWKIAWYTDLGTFSPATTGGVDVGGEESKPFSKWTPPLGAGEQDVHFWMVVRDGRGGMSWITRTLHYKP